MAGALLSDAYVDFGSHIRDTDCIRSSVGDASQRRKRDQGTASLFDVPGSFGASPDVIMNKSMFSPFANSFRSGDSANTALGAVSSGGSTNSDVSAVLPQSPVSGLSGYSPFMGVPWGNNMPNYLSEAPAGPHVDIPSSPMSPGVMFNPSPSPSGLGAPGSPRSLFSSHSPNPFGALSGNGSMRTATGSMQLSSSFTNANANMADAAAAAAAAAALGGGNPLGTQLPPFYYQAAAAAATSAGAAAANNLSLQAALSQSLMGQNASLAAMQQQQLQQQILQASLSAAFSQANNPYLQGYPSTVLSSALEPMRSGGGSLSLDGGLQQQASVAAAAAAAAMLQQQQQQQQHAAAQLRRNLSTPAAVAAQLQLSNAAAAAQAQLGLSHASALSASASALSPLTAQMGRLHVTHSADLSHLDAAHLLGGAGPGSMGQMAARSKFKARKNSEPKIGPDGQPRLNARQRRTLRRAKERALKGLLEVSQALLQKAEVQVTVPNISHLTALEELAAVEAEKELAAGEGNESCLSPGGSLPAGCKGSNNSTQKTRSQQLAAAAAAVEESVCEIARAAVAAVTAQATGKDTSRAAAAAQAAAAQAASAAASAGAVLPPNFQMPEQEEGHSEELQGCDALDCLSHSAPTSPVGGATTANHPSSGRSSSSSSSGRCSSSGSALSSFAGQGAGAAVSTSKPPACQPPKTTPPALTTVSSGSPLVSPSPSPTPATAPKSSTGSQLEGIDIAGLIGQLSLKKDEGMVDDKLIRDLQIIQSLIGALKAPNATTGLDAGATSPSPMSGGARGGSRGGAMSGGGAKGMMVKRANSYSPSSGAF